MRATKQNRRAFSLIEMLAATMLLSISVLAISAISSKSLRAVKLNREYEKAWEVLDAQLTFIDAMGIDEFIDAGRFEGQLGGDDGGGGHFWQAKVEEGEWDNLYRVDLSVSWESENRSRRIQASTFLNGIGSLSLDTDPEESNENQG